MDLENSVIMVTGGASGLGLASAKECLKRDAKVVLVDLERSAGATVAEELGSNASFQPADVTETDAMNAAIEAAQAEGVLRGVIHCAGHGGAVRLVEKDGSPGSLETYKAVINTNLIGSFNVMRLASAAMAKNEHAEGGDRGAIVLTASVAAYEGQIGQIPYAASKAGIVGMTIVAARDLARKNIRVNTIAPGIFDTPLLARLPENVRQSLGATVTNPSRLGAPEEFGKLAVLLLENGYMNGETVRIDGAIRMQPR